MARALSDVNARMLNHAEFVYAPGDRELTKDNIFTPEFGSDDTNGWSEGDTWIALCETIVQENGKWRTIAIFDRNLD